MLLSCLKSLNKKSFSIALPLPSQLFRVPAVGCMIPFLPSSLTLHFCCLLPLPAIFPLFDSFPPPPLHLECSFPRTAQYCLLFIFGINVTSSEGPSPTTLARKVPLYHFLAPCFLIVISNSLVFLFFFPFTRIQDGHHGCLVHRSISSVCFMCMIDANKYSIC